MLVGITDFAVQELCSGNEGDLVYCDLPEPGRSLEAGETFGPVPRLALPTRSSATSGGSF